MMSHAQVMQMTMTVVRERVLAGAIGLLLTVVIVQGSSLSGSTRVDDRRIAVSISGHSYYWFGCSAQKILSFSGSVDLMK
ncbi:hypothetical protein T4D_9965 [Trichinella pseudospiralis]|uniref:Uncharacterized protein n=1 Tax=Trichinella pseudospiralis TaxID=6337 RepID=A0A0V1F858_TRIPS|nr:hypothetical protein T4D_9965 [Trichinella pseudospiralis]